VSSLDQIIASIAAAEESLNQAAAGVRGSDERAADLLGRLTALGADRAAGAVAMSRQQLAEGAAVAAVIGQRLGEVRARIEALRGGAGSAAGPRSSRSGSSVPKPTKSHGTLQKRAGITAGPVRFAVPRKLEGKLSAEHRRQVEEYIAAANQALADGKLPASGRVRPSKDPDLKNAKDAAAARERARAEAAGEPYGDLVAAHLPDTTWTGTPDPPGGWGRHDATINASLGSQSDKYPEGYQPTGFGLDDGWDSVDAEGGDSE
jgi:hypothetical protein